MVFGVEHSINNSLYGRCRTYFCFKTLKWKFVLQSTDLLNRTATDRISW